MSFYSTLVYTSLILSLTACNDNHIPAQSATQTGDSSTVPTIYKDSIELTTLVRNMYEWHDTSLKEASDFFPKQTNPTDTFYSGIDWAAHNNIVNKLKKTGFFAREFLDDYQNIALQIDTALKSGTAVWPLGELPTIGGYEADPWFSAQDTPEGKYWENLTLTEIQWGKDLATIKWSLWENYPYTAKAKKENGIWKISYLQGFDPANYSISN